MSNMEFWEKVKQPPKDALKTIKGGRLSGMTDISPQWRYQAMTEYFGPCGVGWYYEIDKVWSEDGTDGQRFAFAKVNLFTWDKDKEKWSAPINGVGGSMLVSKERNGLHSSDEGYKMAVTDALSVAMKMLGVAADIYLGRFDGSKYKEDTQTSNGFVTKKQAEEINRLISETDSDSKKFWSFAKAETADTIAASDYQRVVAMLKAKRDRMERQPGEDD